ncbi:MAG TPA: MtnX-like HAD-IB family phosphatase [Dehalococcoidales bacterium]|nr:MtnX-like HAD-IB family phosphatase [Dehalococcoidales bacterium]
MIIQSDFDGTLTEEDVSFALLDAFADGDWRKLYEQYRQKKMTVGDFNTKAFAMVKASRDELLKVARAQVKLREGLRNLVNYCQERGFRFLVVSNGLDFYIKAILEDVGLGNIEIYAATTKFTPDGLEVKYIGPEGAVLKKGFKEAYTKLFLTQGYQVVCLGNGPSDYFPAALSQHVFARDGLMDICKAKKLKCQPFDDLNDIVRGLGAL